MAGEDAFAAVTRMADVAVREGETHDGAGVRATMAIYGGSLQIG
jgi:hypothetical protein